MVCDRSEPAKRAFLAWIDAGQEFRPEASRWPIDTLGLRQVAEAKWREYLVGELQECLDTLPDAYCDRMEIPRGSSYGEAVQVISGEDRSRDEEVVP